MSKLRIVVSGMAAGDPHQGGATWAVLQYVLGFRRLGHDTVLVEPVAQLSEQTERYFADVAAEFGLSDRAALVGSGGETVGLPYARLRELIRGADLLVDMSGLLRDREELFACIPVRVYLDLDPAFNQLWHVHGLDVRFDDHTHFVTVGQAIGRDGCAVPTCGREWITTLQPVVLDEWPLANGVAHDALTTVANWRSYGSLEHEGVHYGQKAHSLRELMELPRQTDERFLLALAIHPDEGGDLDALAAGGWSLVDPSVVAGTPRAYRSFVQRSKAELGVAKSGYVRSGCGWFSDRSCCYLASGRPVLAQQTGFGGFLPTGEGLFAFDTADDVLRAVEELRADYARHVRAARALAEAYFDSDLVLGRLLERVGAA
jgi:hypothetical protein